MAEQFDSIVIGAGPAGYVAAIRLAQLGQKVAVVEAERVGGVCLNRGCIPVKALLHAASIVRHANEARTMGIIFNPPQLDPVSIGSWKNRIIDRLVRGIEILFKNNGVALFRGQAKLLAPNRVEVTGPDSITDLTAERVIIATGSRPAVLPGLEPDHKQILDSNSALDLVQLPGTMAIIGAGAIGLEFATIFQRLGIKVTVLEICPNILPGVDPDLANLLQRQMEREGIQFQLGVSGINRLHSDTGLLKISVTGEKPVELEVEKVLVAVGRLPLTAGLGLEQLGVETDGKGFIKTRENYETTVPGVYAIGDVRGGPLLAHKAMYEGINLAETLLGASKPLPGENKAVPWVVYTDPEIASVGLNESRALAEGCPVRISRVPATAIGRSLTLARSEGMCKIVADAQTGKILGVGIVAPQADVLIAEATCAVELGLTAEQLGEVIHPHPTMSEILFEAAHAVLGSAVHILNR